MGSLLKVNISSRKTVESICARSFFRIDLDKQYFSMMRYLVLLLIVMYVGVNIKDGSVDGAMLLDNSPDTDMTPSDETPMTDILINLVKIAVEFILTLFVKQVYPMILELWKLLEHLIEG